MLLENKRKTDKKIEKIADKSAGNEVNDCFYTKVRTIA